MSKIILPVLCLLCTALWQACSPVSRRALNKRLIETEKEFHDHTGFLLFNPATRKVILEHNSDRYFTPASNTKIFTLFAGLSILGDSVPGLLYAVKGDSMIIAGTGDPSFLYPNVFNNEKILCFLKKSPYPIYYTERNFETTHFGPGWSWEDYDYAYSSERSPFPIYGNAFEVTLSGDSLQALPSYFNSVLIRTTDTLAGEARLVRLPRSNVTTYYPGRFSRHRKWIKPFITDAAQTACLLSDTLHRSVTFTGQPIACHFRTLYSVPVDSLYRVMMQDSDNFIAEQLLLTCAAVLSDTLKPEIAIDYMKKNFLTDLPDEPIWIDGSGLSRYNLFTPRSVVKLWDKILLKVPPERLFKLLAVGGVAGTIRNSYINREPYIFGKTGTLSNVHCLSGYIVSKKGKTLIFSFMNTNYTTSAREIRSRMEEILKIIHNKY